MMKRDSEQVGVGRDEAVAALMQLASGRGRFVAFTGAGISTESGIPDYRGPGGVWEQRKPPTIGDYLHNEETRRHYWERRRLDYPTLSSREPNQGHLALARLETMGVLTTVITQNIDGLHQKAGNADDRVIELHGTAHRIRCMTCERLYDAGDIQQRLLAGEPDPPCANCGGVLRSATVLFGESLPREALDRAISAAQECDFMLVVGSSLVVNPAAKLPALAKRQGAAIAIINRTVTAADELADVHILGEAGPTLNGFANAIAEQVEPSR